MTCPINSSKTTITFTFLILSFSLLLYAHGNPNLNLGGQTYPIQFEDSTMGAAMREIVAEDVSRIFAPLLNISNVVDVAKLTPDGEQVPLRLKETPTYPGDFRGNVSFSVQNGNIVFCVSQALCDLYAEKLSEISSITNSLRELDGIVSEIRSGSITNWVAPRKLALPYFPPTSTDNITAEEGDILATSLVMTKPFPYSLLDVEHGPIGGSPHWIVPTKSTVVRNGDVQASFVLWIYDDGKWKILFESALY